MEFTITAKAFGEVIEVFWPFFLFFFIKIFRVSGVTAPMVDWAKHDKLEPQEHHVKKRSPFFPGMDGIFQPISGLFQRGGDDWRPNIPYVIFSRGQPGFDRTGAVQQVSRPLRNPVFYENGVGGVRARPVGNPRGLRPIDFNINESQLRGRSGGFK